MFTPLSRVGPRCWAASLSGCSVEPCHSQTGTTSLHIHVVGSCITAPVPKPSRGGAVSPRGGAKRAMWNPEWERLRVLAAGLSPLLFGDVRNFLLQPVGEAVVRGPETRVRAHLLGDQQGQPILVVLKVRSSDWMAVRHVEGALKALQARLLDESPAPVLDLTGPESVLVGSIPTAVGEHLQIALWRICGSVASCYPTP